MTCRKLVCSSASDDFLVIYYCTLQKAFDVLQASIRGKEEGRRKAKGQKGFPPTARPSFVLGHY